MRSPATPAGPSARLGPGLFALLVLAGLSAYGPPAVAAVADESTVVDLLARAREAARTEDYTGTMLVEWQDGRRSRTARVTVRSAGGVIRIGDDVVGRGAHRLIRSADGWQTLWRHDVIALGPSPARKYSLSLAAGPDIAGYATDVVEVRRRAGGSARERIYLQRETGLMLRQELLDARGRPYRAIGFEEVRPSPAGPAAPGSPTASPKASPKTSPKTSPKAGPKAGPKDREPQPVRSVPAFFRAPKQVGDGYRLVGTYEGSGKVLHLFYSDGLHGLSVFEQRGRLTTRSMPAGGRVVELAGHEVRSYPTSVGEAVVWQGEGLVYTVVSDAHRDDVAVAVGDLSHAGRPGRLRQVAEAVAGLFRWR